MPQAPPGHCPACGRKTLYRHKRTCGAGEPSPPGGYVKEWCPGGFKANQFRLREVKDAESRLSGE